MYEAVMNGGRDPNNQLLFVAPHASREQCECLELKLSPSGAEDEPLREHVYKLADYSAHAPKVVSRSCLGSRAVAYQALSIAKKRRAWGAEASQTMA